ncbi:uncharacterized protein LOC125704378 isoform X2 [Brienomyrus brachyistius]|uniref:uncharacterized protein LOC125704378 isoform X2 n=1 Tax=Brienomyrus brachyistius TaxID=42636 RepID=UPI0020B2D451|nr:uncharacterized protein LOC125704378 isoform X2 [Brienomyrus brachyistius]
MVIRLPVSGLPSGLLQLEGEQLSGTQELQGRLAWMGVERSLLAAPLRAPGSQWERLFSRRDSQDEKYGDQISADPGGALEVDAGNRAREQKEEEVEEGDEERQKLEPQRAFRHLCLRHVLMREFPKENDVPRTHRPQLYGEEQQEWSHFKNGQKAAGSRPSHWNPWQEYPDVANQITVLVIELQQLRRVCRTGGSPDSLEDMEARDWLERAALLKHCVGVMENNEARLAALRREVAEMKQGKVMDQVAFQRKEL